MKISNLAVKYRTSVIVLTVVLAVGGLLSYVTIPKEANPSIEIPIIIITTVYPGVSPTDVESLITQPIEREVQGVNGIKEIRSTTTEGVSTVVVEFNPEVSMDDAYQRVKDKVDLAKPKLPSDVEEPLVNEINLQEFPILTINLAANYSLARLKQVAEDIQDELEAIPSILGVDLIGGIEQEMQVNVDLIALQGYNLTFQDVINTIQEENVTIPGGSVDVERLNYLVRVSGEFKDTRDIENLVVKVPERRGQDARPSPIYIRDVADVEFGFKDRTSYSRLIRLQDEDEHGNLIQVADADISELHVISLNVKQRSGENILTTVARVHEILDDFPMPSGTQVVITGDQSKYIRNLVTDLENNIISGLIFVVAVLLFFLGVRNAMLVGIAIPLSMFTAFIVFQALGYTLNFIILFSLIIALGMLVDNAVVIVENIYRFREQGHSRFEAARLGTSEVGGAVTAATATTIAAFAPMLFWPGIIGKFMSFLPLTLIITLSSSLFVALVINPVVTGFLMRLETEKKQPMGLWAKRIGYGAMAMAAIVIGLANPITLGVLILLGGIVFLLHRHVMKPVGDSFVRNGVPRMTARYKAFLGWILKRDYSVQHPYLRNALSLGSFALGFVLLIAGLAAQSAFGQPAALVLLGPAALLLGVGLVGIFIHSLEAVFISGWRGVIGGFVFGLFMFGLLTLIYFSPRPLAIETMSTLMALPVVIILVGFLGTLRRKKTPLILTDNRAMLMNTTLGALFAIVMMFMIAPTGQEFFPETDPQQILVSIEGDLGTNLETSDRIAYEASGRILDLLGRNPESKANIENMLVNVGVGGDAMFGGGAATAERTRLTLNVVDYADRHESSSTTMSRIRNQIRGIPGTEIKVEQNQMGPPTGEPVNIEVAGEDFSEIVRISSEIRDMLARASETGLIAGLVDVRDNLNTGRPEYQVNIDRERAARFGLNTRQIASTIRTAISGTEASQYRDGENEYDITVRLREFDRRTLESLRDLTILYEGQQIPLVAVADFEVGSGLGSITRKDLQRVVTVQGGTAPGYPGPEVLQEVREYLSDYEQSLPPGYTMQYTGESEDQEEAFGFLGTALLIGIALIFMILVSQFNRVSAPFVIMTAVGLSMIGVMLGLILTRTPFGLMTFIGVISLAGIVVNNAIVLVDYIMQLRERGLSKMDAIVEGGATRLRPVLLTALTTILGLIPLTFGINIDFVGLLTNFDPAFRIGSENTQFWGPMGTAIISGLTFATFLTLVIVPVMYSLFDSVGVRMGILMSGGLQPAPTYVTPDGRMVASTDLGLDRSEVGGDGIGDYEYAPDGTLIPSGNGKAEPQEEPAKPVLPD